MRHFYADQLARSIYPYFTTGHPARLEKRRVKKALSRPPRSTRKCRTGNVENNFNTYYPPVNRLIEILYHKHIANRLGRLYGYFFCRSVRLDRKLLEKKNNRRLHVDRARARRGEGGKRKEKKILALTKTRSKYSHGIILSLACAGRCGTRR